MRNARVLCGALILASAWAAAAWAADPSPSGVASCRGITDDKQRLACFDRESALPQQPARGADTRDAKKDAQNAEKRSAVSVPASPVLSPEQRMGLDPARILKLQGSQGTADLKELTAKIRYVSGDLGSRRYFTLENGQVWRQVEAESEFTVRPGDTVHITRAMFGSYFMAVSRHMATRVSRAR